jgi:hypothetical protein
MLRVLPALVCLPGRTASGNRVLWGCPLWKRLRSARNLVSASVAASAAGMESWASGLRSSRAEPPPGTSRPQSELLAKTKDDARMWRARDDALVNALWWQPEEAPRRQQRPPSFSSPRPHPLVEHDESKNYTVRAHELQRLLHGVRQQVTALTDDVERGGTASADSLRALATQVEACEQHAATLLRQPVGRAILEQRRRAASAGPPRWAQPTHVSEGRTTSPR